VARGRNELKVDLIARDRTLGKGLRGAGKDVDTLGRRLDRLNTRMGQMGTTLTTRVTLPIVAGLGLATKAAIDEEKEMTLLSAALHKNAGATDAQVAAVERWITKTQNATGIADGELRPALASLTRVTKDVGTAQDILGVAMDISTGSGRDLQTVTLALQKAYMGSAVGLSRLGIATKDASGKTLSFDQIMKKAAKTFGGDTAAAASSAAGKMAILRARFSDITESIGTSVIPVVERLLPYVERTTKWFENLSDGQRDMLVKAALIGAAAGPVMKMTSMLYGGGRAAGRFAGSLATLIKRIAGAGTAATTASGAGQLSYFSGKTFTGKQKNVAGLSGKLGTLATRLGAIAGPAAAAAAGIALLYSHGQSANDWVTGKLTGMTPAEIKKEHDLKSSRFGGKAAREFTTKYKANTTDFDAKTRQVSSKLAHIHKTRVEPKVKITGPGNKTVTQEAQGAQDAIRAVLAKDLGQSVRISFGFGGTGGGTGAGLGFSGALRGFQAAQLAKQQIGDSYAIGATGPNVFDCSGLVKYVYNRSGLPGFPTYTGNQWPLGRQVAKDALMPGDQLFMKTGIPEWTDQFGWGHTGIYVGNGMYVHASGKRTGVIMSSVASIPYPWAAKRHFFASGGLIKAQPGGVNAVLGEAGEDELVITKLRSAEPRGSDGASLAGVSYVVHMHNPVFMSGEDAIGEMERAARRRARVRA